MKAGRAQGQALLELAICLPALLLLLWLAHAAFLTAWARANAQSAARSELLRSGRRLPPFGASFISSTAPGCDNVAVRSATGRTSAAAPFIPLAGALAGRSESVVTVEKRWIGTSLQGTLPSICLSRRLEGSLDCWDMGSPSGRRIRAAARAVALAGGIR